MRGRLLLLALGCASGVFGQYTYDYSIGQIQIAQLEYQGYTPSGFSGFMAASSSNGTYYLSPQSSGWSFYPSSPVSGNANDYEINTSLWIQSGSGGTLVHFLRANWGISPPYPTLGSGSYISVQLAVPLNYQPPAPVAMELTVNQCVNGTVTQLGSTTISAATGTSLRSVIFGTTLLVYSNNVLVWSQQVPSTTGAPAVGGQGSNGFTYVAIGHHDALAPSAVAYSSMASSIFPNSASLKWGGAADDPVGIGVYDYVVTRNGTWLTDLTEPEFTDETVQASTSYTYQIAAEDYHGNIGAATTIAVNTPPAGAIDPRRVGVRSTGSYWGGGGEQIDTLSGNLNFTLPLITAMGRNGAKIPINLNYNSQNWRQDSGVNWNLGSDVGYGYGWRLVIGSITPYYTGLTGVDHYVFTDNTGAEYRLTVDNGGIWSSTDGIRVWFDSNANVLHFPDGSFWTMGCVSAGAERDAGTMYPTVVEDVDGNQIAISYMTGAGVGAANSSARISLINDPRATSSVYGTYGFTWNTDSPVPHLTGISNTVQSGETYTLAYAGATMGPPFGSDPNYAGATTTQLTSLSKPSTSPYDFSYDSAGASELLEVVFPYGGHLRWSYGTDPYNGNRDLRAIEDRYLAADSAGQVEWTYPFTRDNASGGTVHATASLVDASGVGAKTWNFITPTGGAAWQVGLLSQYVQSASLNGTVVESDSYTWSQDPGGNPYISATTKTMDPGSSNPQSVLTTQTVDVYGNVTQAVQYPYNNTTTPVMTTNNVYLTGSAYAAGYVLNRLLSTTVTAGSSQITTVTNYYDGACPTQTSFACNSGDSATNMSFSSNALFDQSPPVPWLNHGHATFTVTPAVSKNVQYYNTGVVYSSNGSDGSQITAGSYSGTNGIAAGSASTPSYSATFAYTAWMGLSSASGADGQQVSATYDSAGRPSTGTSVFGGITMYAYSTAGTQPSWQNQTNNVNQGYTKTYLDGMGRTVRVEQGTVSPSQVISYTDTIYQPCACSPLGKIVQVSQPYAPGGTPVYTTYTYDGIGRNISTQQPDGASTTTTGYLGNQSTVTDPAGNWKQFTSDALGNLLSVSEPDPLNQPGGTLTTSYSYDWMNHVTQVTMTRAGTTQNRTFVYDSAGRLTSATNPENGTVTYVYGTDNTLQSKTDAKGQKTVYTYSSTTKQLTEVQKFINGTEDTCQRVNYNWYYNSVGYISYGSCVPGSIVTGYTDYFTYTNGSVSTKHHAVCTVNNCANYYVDYGYTGLGQPASMTYWLVEPTPNLAPSQIYNQYSHGITLTYQYDAMGRAIGLLDPYMMNVPWTQSVQYDVAGRMTTMQYLSGASYSGSTYSGTYVSEAMSYNANGQVTALSFGGSTSGGFQYNYSPTQNNGQVTSVVDTLSGETIVYQYDQLKRLSSASSTPNTGSSVTPWTQTFQYDGFGNLTAKVLNGTTDPIPVNAATNQLSSAIYDLNGNMTSGAGATLGYDEVNRLVSAQETSGGIEYYGYSPDNKMIDRMLPNGSEEWTFYGAHGEKLAVYAAGSVWPIRSNVYFAGKLIWSEGVAPVQDRVGTNRVYGARFLPYGEPTTSTGSESASGGIVSYSGGYEIHTFTGGGTFVLNGPGAVTAQVLVVGGGGGAGGGNTDNFGGGGGGAGGVVYSSSYTINPGTYTVTVGASGTGGSQNHNGTSGGSSTFSTLTGVGGGYGGGGWTGSAGGNGGSGGGSGGTVTTAEPGGSGTSGQGSGGGSGEYSSCGTSGGAGGGAGGAGANGAVCAGQSAGGSGVSYSISGSAVTYGAGGNGANYDDQSNGAAGAAGTGSGGTGGGGGQGVQGGTGGAGGSGIVIIAIPQSQLSGQGQIISDDQVKFGTYLGDGYTGLDYANQRWFANAYGRFNTPDPYMALAKGANDPKTPQNWNRYAYVQGDPVNEFDPRGTYAETPEFDVYAGGPSGLDWGTTGPCIPDPILNVAVCGGTASLVSPAANSSQAQQPQCSISLHERPVGGVASMFGADHSYIDVTQNYGSGSATQTTILEGGPTPGGSPVGLLTGYVSTTGVGVLNGTNPSLSSNVQVGSTISGSWVCGDVQTIENAVASYNDGPKVAYVAVPNIITGGYNSNSFAYSLLNDVGLAYSFGYLPAWTPGWGIQVPGLSSVGP